MQNSIFVSIVSYRDSDCENTLKYLFNQARYPNRIFAGVVLQYKLFEDKVPCIPDEIQPNVRWLILDYKSARGPCYARGLCQDTLFNGEEYYLQIDSHMRFAKDWDVKLIEMLEKCESSKPIITSYPPAFSFDDDLLPEKPTLLVADKFSGDDGFLRIRSRFLNDLKFNSPIPSFFWAAGFSFSHSSLISQVSYFNRVENSTDSLDYLFFGEESFMSVRLWLSGWDFFAPNSSLIFHQWSRKYRPTFSELFKDNIHGTQRYLLKLGAMEFVSNFLENLHNFSSDPFTGYPYTRTISQYVEFSGVDYSNRTISSKSTNGGIDPLNFYSQNQILSLIQQNKFLLSYSAW